MQNTLARGRYRWIIFKDGKEWVGAALEFNIIVTGDDPRVVEADLQEAAVGYLEAVRKLKGMRPQQMAGILNQTPDESYEARYVAAQEAARGNVLSPLSPNIYKFGVSNLSVT